MAPNGVQSGISAHAGSGECSRSASPVKGAEAPPPAPSHPPLSRRERVPSCRQASPAESTGAPVSMGL